MRVNTTHFEMLIEVSNGVHDLMSVFVRIRLRKFDYFSTSIVYSYSSRKYKHYFDHLLCLKIFIIKSVGYATFINIKLKTYVDKTKYPVVNKCILKLEKLLVVIEQ